jgi:hypothetical protein
MDEEDDERGFRITLPPITLPDFFPEGFRPNFRPAERVRTPGASPLTVLALALLLDAADAALVLAGAGGALPALLTAVLAVVLLGKLGALQLWEVLPVLLAPLSPLGAFPTLTALALLQLRGELHVLGVGHPEHVEGDAEREGQPEQRDE